MLQFRISNEAVEPLPASVEINGASVPLTWQHKRELSTHDKTHVRVRLRIGRPPSAPPMGMAGARGLRASRTSHHHRESRRQGSLASDGRFAALDFNGPVTNEVRNTSMWRKAPARPSAQGTHLDTVSEGYRWTGTSSTYAIPAPKAPRAKSFPPRSSISTQTTLSPAGMRASNSAAARASALERSRQQRQISAWPQSRSGPVPHPSCTRRQFRNAHCVSWRVHRRARRRRQPATTLGARSARKSAHVEGRALPARGEQQLGQRHGMSTKPSRCA